MIKTDAITEKHIDEFSDVLQKLNRIDLHLEQYQSAYLNLLLLHKNYFLRIYTEILNEVLNKSSKRKEDIFLMDYGAGNGLLGLFAKFCGFGKIVQIDTSPGCNASQKILSQKLNIPIAENILGDFELLEKYASDPPDALVGTDVIEHIYDLNKFLSALQKLNKNIILVFTTASNDRNWWKKKKLMSVQHKDECIGYNPENGNESLLPFREVRKNIISSQLPDIDESELEKLITHTRGLRKDDIIKSCKIYLDKNILPPLIDHPTNTCDPLSGSWTERFLSFSEYKKLFNSNGYTLFIKNGFYNNYQSGIKGRILYMANILIKLLGKPGSIISPFIILTGTGISNNEKQLNH